MKKMMQVDCPNCHYRQNYRGQDNCIHCMRHMPIDDLIEQIQLRKWEMQMKFSDKDEKPS